MRLLPRLSKKSGQAPGSLVYTGLQPAEATRVSMTVVDYDSSEIEIRDIKALEECIPYRNKPTMTWINISGLHDISVIEKAGELFHVHPLVLEDILNVHQRQKIEDYEDYLFIVTKLIDADSKNNGAIIEQMSILVFNNLVITFLERRSSVFEPIFKRLSDKKSRIRRHGVDYFTYVLLDRVIDDYFIILDKYSEQIENLELELGEHPSDATLEEIYSLKRSVIHLRKSAMPAREIAKSLLEEDYSYITDKIEPYLRDVHDHILQVVDIIDNFRDVLSGLVEAYNSAIAKRTNDVMKVLTIVATIFIPLTFLAGIYGMNFKYMPELEWRWGYFWLLGIMLLAVIGMLLYFKKKDWI